MRKDVSTDYQDNLTELFLLISNREFEEAELKLLRLIKDTIKTKAYRQHEVIAFFRLIYNDFNSTYFRWLTKSGSRIRVKLSDLYTKEHDNYLIGNCSDPAAMDDLLYELIYCSSDEQNNEVNTHYNYYIARIKNYSKKH